MSIGHAAAAGEPLEGDGSDFLDDLQPSPIWLANWALMAAFVAAAFIPVASIWRIRPEYRDRFLIPLASCWMAYLLAGRLRRMSAPGRGAALGLAPWLLGMLSFQFAWFVQVQTGSTRIIVWWLLVSVLTAVAGLAAFQLGWRQLRLLAFPLAFNFFCLPLPGKLHGPLENGLKELATQISARCLPMFGVTTVRNGHVLRLPSGDLGVEDACSGIRSFSALMAIACLVAYWRGFGLVRGLALAILTVPIVVLANGGRVIVTGLLQEWVGRWSIEGWLHDALGFLTVLIGLALILGVSEILRPRGRAASPSLLADEPALEHRDSPEGSPDGRIVSQPATAVAETPSIVRPSPDGFEDDGEAAADKRFVWTRQDRRGLPILVCMTLFAIAATASAVLYRTEPGKSIRLADIPTQIGRWTGFELDVPEFIREQLIFDTAFNRIYRSPTGHEISVWVVYWSATDFVPGPHSPDICWPSRGWNVQGGGRQKLVSKIHKTELEVEFREYVFNHREQCLLFWTQENNVILSSVAGDDESNLGDKRWILNALFQRNTRLRPTKMFVLAGAETWGTRQQTLKEVVDFCEAFVDELYRVAPDCRPGVSSAPPAAASPPPAAWPIPND